MKIHIESAQLPETEVIIRGDVTSDEVVSLLQILKKKTGGKLLLYKEDEQHLLEEGEIVFAEVCGSHLYVYTKTDTYEAKMKLYELKEQLSRSFVQVNKSTLVNMNCVKSIQAEFSGNYRMKLKNRKEILTLSRNYFKDFKEHI